MGREGPPGGPGSLRVRPYGARAPAQRGHLQDGLRGDFRAHLRRAALAIAERDRYLAHLEARLDRPVGQLDLEAVAVGVDPVEVERLEHSAAEGLEAARQAAHGDAEDPPRVPGAAAREEPAAEAPVHHAAARHIARAE